MLPEIETLFTSLSDDRLLRSTRTSGTKTPLDDFLRAYSDMTLDRPELPVIEATWTGADLKKTVQALSETDQHALLDSMGDRNKIVGTWTYAETPEARDNRQLKHWLIRFSMIFTAVIVTILVSAVSFSIYKSGIGSNSDLLKSIFNTLVEILKLIFGVQTN